MKRIITSFDTEMKISPQRYLQGESPSARSENNLKKVALHLLEFGFTSGHIIQLLLNKLGRNWPAWAIRKGYLRQTRPPSGYPSYIYTLTADGLAIALRNSDIAIEYPELDPRRISFANLRHSLYTQEFCLEAKNRHNIYKILGARNYPEGFTVNNKVPDAILLHRKDGAIAVEAELTGKWGVDLDDFVFKVVKALSPDSEGKRRFDLFLIASDSKATLRRYQVRFADGAKVPAWKRFQGKWYRNEDNDLTITPDISSRVRCVYLDFMTSPARPKGHVIDLPPEAPAL